MEKNVTIQTASSRGTGASRNSDGTITIRCRICFNAICDVDAGRNKFNTAICEICAREEKGEIIPAEIEAQMRTLRMPNGQRIPLSTFENVKDPMVDSSKPIVGRPEYWFHAITKKAAKKVEAVAKAINPLKKKKYKDPTAQELAAIKRHKPLFSDGIEINIKKKE